MFLQDTIRGRRVSSGFVHAFFGQLRRLMISHEQSLLLAVTVLAILMRCLHARALFYSPISDAWCYVTYAFNIFSGETPDIVTLTFPPGYPIWLFFLTRVLQIPLVNPVLYIQAILNGLATVAIYATAKKLYGQPAGFLAGFFFAIYEPFIFTSGWLMTEALFIPLSAIWLFCLTEYMFNRSTVYLVLTALLIGAIVNVRPNTVFYLLPMVILILTNHQAPSLKSKAKDVAILATIVAAVALPWSTRNSVITKRPSFVAVYSGINLFYGNNPLATGGFINPETAGTEAYEFSTSVPYTPEYITQCENEYREEAKRFILSHIFYELFYLIPARLFSYFGDLRPTAETIKYWAGTDQGLFAAYPFGPKIYSWLLDWWILYPLGCVGVFLRGRLPRWLFPSFWLVHLLPFLICFANSRHRIPSDIFLIFPAAALCAKVLTSANYLVTKRLLMAYCGIAVMFSGINWLRFSGPNLLEQPRWVSPLSAEAEQLTRETLTLLEPKSVPLWEVQLAPGIAPHLLLKFDYRITSPSNNKFIGPNISWKFVSARGKEVTMPFGGGKLLRGEHVLNRFQETTSTAWCVIKVPAAATKMIMSLENDIMGIVYLSNFRLHAPVWFIP